MLKAHWSALSGQKMILCLTVLRLYKGKDFKVRLKKFGLYYKAYKWQGSLGTVIEGWLLSFAASHIAPQKNKTDDTAF